MSALGGKVTLLDLKRHYADDPEGVLEAIEALGTSGDAQMADQMSPSERMGLLLKLMCEAAPDAL